MRWLAALALGAAPLAAQEVVVIGDSIMDWNGRASIPAVLDRISPAEVDDRSVAGARFSAGPLARLSGFEIRAQLGRDRPEIVVMTGGGNDLGEECGCRDCDATLDALIAPDSRSGELPAFAARLDADGTALVYVGYYDDPVGGGPFSACGPAFDALDARLEALAELLPGFSFISAKTVIDPADLSLYDRDRVHPSPAGSERIARLIADHLATVSR